MVEVGEDPVGVAAGAGDVVWVVSFGPSELARIPAGSAEPDLTVEVGNTPLRVVEAYDAVWLTAFHAGELNRVDRRSGKVTDRLDVGEGAEGVAAGFGSVWVVAQDAGKLVRVDPKTRTIVGPRRHRRRCPPGLRRPRRDVGRALRRRQGAARRPGLGRGDGLEEDLLRPAGHRRAEGRRLGGLHVLRRGRRARPEDPEGDDARRGHGRPGPHPRHRRRPGVRRGRGGPDGPRARPRHRRGPLVRGAERRCRPLRQRQRRRRRRGRRDLGVVGQPRRRSSTPRCPDRSRPGLDHRRTGSVRPCIHCTRRSWAWPAT